MHNRDESPCGVSRASSDRTKKVEQIRMSGGTSGLVKKHRQKGWTSRLRTGLESGAFKFLTFRPNRGTEIRESQGGPGRGKREKSREGEVEGGGGQVKGGTGVGGERGRGRKSGKVRYENPRKTPSRVFERMRTAQGKN